MIMTCINQEFSERGEERDEINKGSGDLPSRKK